MTAIRTADDQRCERERRQEWAERREGDAGKRAQQALPAQRSCHPQPEEHVPEEIDRRAGDDDRDLLRGQHIEWMCDHELISDGGQNHARHEDDVQVGVAVAGQSRAVGGGLLEPLLCHGCDVVEVQPPHRRGREEGDAECGDPCSVDVEAGGRGAGDHDRLAERDDDEQLEAVGEMARLDVPRRFLEPPPARHPEDDERCAVVDQQSGDPQPRAQAARRRGLRRARALRLPRTRSGSCRRADARSCPRLPRQTSGTCAARPGSRRNSPRREALGCRTPPGSPRTSAGSRT